MREGRARVGRDASATPVDFARALARLGVARGIDAFERYGYIERNGQANLAVPLGRWHVATQPHQRLLDEIDRWLHMLRRAARDDKSPGAWRSAARLCDEAVLAVCRNGRDASRWQRLLLALAAAEQALVSSPKRTADQGLRPIPPLSPEWVHAADDGGAEARLAVALASQHAGWPPTSHPVREHWTPLDGSGLRFASDAKSIAIGPDVVCTGVDLERDCVALVRRRVLRARSAWKAEEGRPRPLEEALPLVAPWACSARLRDIDAFLSRATDDARVLGLARAFMAVRWREWGDEPLERGGDPPPPNALHAIFRLVHLPHGLLRGDDQVPITVDPEVVARLAAGNLAAAASTALRRLRASGLRPVVRAIAGDAALARRLAASLAFALHPTDVARAADAVTKPYAVEAS
jgi:CRISPR-associated protein Csx17